MIASLPFARVNLLNSAGTVAPGTSVTITLVIAVALPFLRRDNSSSSLDLDRPAANTSEPASARTIARHATSVFRGYQTALALVLGGGSIIRPLPSNIRSTPALLTYSCP